MGVPCVFHIEVQNVMLLLPQKVLWVILIESRARGKYGFKASSASWSVKMSIQRHSQEEQSDSFTGMIWHLVFKWTLFSKEK